MQPKTKQDTSKDDKTNHRFWQAHIKALRKSGFSRAEYCHLNNLSYHALAYWQKRIGTEGGPEMTNSIGPVAQIPSPANISAGSYTPELYSRPERPVQDRGGRELFFESAHPSDQYP